MPLEKYTNRALKFVSFKSYMYPVYKLHVYIQQSKPFLLIFPTSIFSVYAGESVASFWTNVSTVKASLLDILQHMREHIIDFSLFEAKWVLFCNIYILQHINTSDFRVCLKELYADQHDPVNVAYVVLAGGYGSRFPKAVVLFDNRHLAENLQTSPV